MFEVMIRLSDLALPVFVFCTMANVGLTQDLRRIVRYWRDWPFYLRMLVTNFVAAPTAMWVMLELWPLPIEHRAGLLVFSLCAGAPFLIKLTAATEHDLALGAATMMMLVVATIAIAPLALPALLPGLSVDGAALAWTLTRQLLAPMLAGALVARLLPGPSGRLQPLVARLANIALYVVVAATIVGYAPETPAIARSGALLLGLLFILAAFGLGRLAGIGQEDLEDIGGLATAQRNTAAAMLIAVNSFSDPTAFVLITVVNTVGLIVLMAVARAIGRDNVTVERL